jgi:uncharacterized caspase-like protein
VAKILAGETVAVSNIQIAKDFPPKLVWVNPVGTVSEQTFVVVVQFKGSSIVHDIAFTHNNKPIEVQLPKDKTEGEVSIPLKLTSFDNVINMRAYDKNTLKSDWVKADFQYSSGSKGPGSKVTETRTKAQELGDYGKKYAIIIGIADYKNLSEKTKAEGGLTDLKYADKDAEAFKKFLETKELSGSNKWEIKSFVNKEATSIEVDKALTGVLTNANARDLIFIFFSGHGRSHPQREQDVYLLTYDFEESNYRSGFDYEKLISLIRGSKTEHIIAFIDACRSGVIGIGGKGGTEGTFNQDFLKERLKDIPENKIVFTAGSGTQRAWEDETWDLGVFTHFLLKGLQGEAEEQKNPNFVDLGELGTYVRQEVEKHTSNNKSMARQTPDFQDVRGLTNEEFPVAIRRK